MRVRMSKITEYIIIIALIVILGFVIFGRVSPPETGGISPEAQHKLDSLVKSNTQYMIDKAVLLSKNSDLENEVDELEAQLTNIKPKYIPVYKEYNEGTREKKSELVKSEYEKRLKERQGDK